MSGKQIMNMAIGIAAGLALWQAILAGLQYAGIKKAVQNNQG